MARTDSIAFLVIAALATLSGAVHAQYKWVAPDGTVSYGDQPPPQADKVNRSVVASPPPVGDPTLPYALRTAVARYPVKLYSGASCGPCDAARQHLAKRGVPFTEQVLRTQADLDALKREGFTNTDVPAISVGRSRQTGFEAGAWDAMLDAAAYPKTSMLPPGWKPHAPESAKPAEVAGSPTSDPAAPSDNAPRRVTVITDPLQLRANERAAQLRDLPPAPAQSAPGGVRF